MKPDLEPPLVELLPCGNCHAPARWVELAWRVKCTRPSCGVKGGEFETRKAAIAAWNTRTPPPAMGEEAIDAHEAREAEVARLRGALEPFLKVAEHIGRRDGVVIGYGPECNVYMQDFVRLRDAALASTPADVGREEGTSQ